MKIQVHGFYENLPFSVSECRIIRYLHDINIILREGYISTLDSQGHNRNHCVFDGITPTLMLLQPSKKRCISGLLLGLEELLT